jgi:tripartite-type tricarboxylate transporter receptor subunit TctC
MRLVSALALALVVGAVAPAFAEYPERPITVIIPFAPGGGADLTTRTLFPFVEKYLAGSSFIPVNRTGGGGEVGFTEVALAPPDGYKIGLVPTPTLTMKPWEHETHYKIDGFTYIANVAYDPSAIAVRKDSPYNSLSDLLTGLKDGKKVVAAIAGIGSEDHLLIARLQAKTSTTMTLAPFESSGESILALLGGHVDLAVVNTASASSALGEGTIRLLAVADDTRWKQAPDVPTFTELGIPLLGGSTRGYAGPAGLPADVTKKLADAIAGAMKDPEFIAAAAKEEIGLRYMDSMEFTRFVQEQSKALGEQWKVDPWVK